MIINDKEGLWWLSDEKNKPGLLNKGHKLKVFSSGGGSSTSCFMVLNGKYKNNIIIFHNIWLCKC